MIFSGQRRKTKKILISSLLNSNCSVDSVRYVVNGKWMDGWMDEWMDGWMNGWTDGQTDGRTDGQTDGLMDGRTDYLDGWMIG